MSQLLSNFAWQQAHSCGIAQGSVSCLCIAQCSVLSGCLKVFHHIVALIQLCGDLLVALMWEVHPVHC